MKSERRLSTQRRKFYLGVKRLLEHSTVHGLCHVSTASTRIGRSVWLILWMAGVAGFFTNLSFIVSRYMTRPVLTSYTHDHEPFIWPDITLCNPMAPYLVHLHNRTEKWNALRRRAAIKAHNISGELFSSIDEADWQEITIQALVHSTLSPTEFGVGNVHELVQFAAADSGHKGILLTQELDGNLSQLIEPISDYFHVQVLQKRNNIPCYTLQLAHVLDDNQCKSIEKVSLGLKFNYDSFVIINSSYAPPNIDLFITLPGHIPENEPLVLLAGYDHQLSVSMGRFTREPMRRPCRTEQFVAQVFDADLTTRRRVIGSAEFCHKLVSQRLYLNHCACYSPFLPYPVIDDGYLFRKQPILCFNMSHFNTTLLDRNAQCMHDVYLQYRDHRVYMNLPEAKYCEKFRAKPPCESVSYMLEGLRRTPLVELWSDNENEARTAFLTSQFQMVFGQDLPKKRLEQLLNNTEAGTSIRSFMRKNLGLLTVHRKLPRGTLTHEELEYPLSELLSDVGGLMGLWIGISVIGLFEVIELLAFVGLSVVSALLERCLTQPPSSDNTQKESNCLHAVRQSVSLSSSSKIAVAHPAPEIAYVCRSPAINDFNRTNKSACGCHQPLQKDKFSDRTRMVNAVWRTQVKPIEQPNCDHAPLTNDSNQLPCEFFDTKFNSNPVSYIQQPERDLITANSRYPRSNRTRSKLFMRSQSSE